MRSTQVLGGVVMWGASPRGTVHTREHVASRAHTHDREGREPGRAGCRRGSPALSQVTGDRGFHVSEPQFAAL